MVINKIKKLTQTSVVIKQIGLHMCFSKRWHCIIIFRSNVIICHPFEHSYNGYQRNVCGLSLLPMRPISISVIASNLHAIGLNLFYNYAHLLTTNKNVNIFKCGRGSFPQRFCIQIWNWIHYVRSTAVLSLLYGLYWQMEE